jgi:hypothetical protein
MRWNLKILTRSVANFFEFLGAFAKLLKATISFFVSIRPSVRMKQLGTHWTFIHEIL